MQQGIKEGFAHSYLHISSYATLFSCVTLCKTFIKRTYAFCQILRVAYLHFGHLRPVLD